MSVARPGRFAGLLLLMVQVGLASSIAGKYALDRATLPRVWARAAPYDPDRPLRGRYLALQVLVDGCALTRGNERNAAIVQPGRSHPGPTENWGGVLVSRAGVLTAIPAPQARPDRALRFERGEDEDCRRTRLREPLNYFIPERAATPRLAAGEELWAEVTVPPAGPPRPIQLAIGSTHNFQVLALR